LTQGVRHVMVITPTGDTWPDRPSGRTTKTGARK
jgi:hypothetical protein